MKKLCITISLWALSCSSFLAVLLLVFSFVTFFVDFYDDVCLCGPPRFW
jgi:hypothetical protein